MNALATTSLRISGFFAKPWSAERRAERDEYDDKNHAVCVAVPGDPDWVAVEHDVDPFRQDFVDQEVAVAVYLPRHVALFRAHLLDADLVRRICADAHAVLASVDLSALRALVAFAHHHSAALKAVLALHRALNASANQYGLALEAVLAAHRAFEPRATPVDELGWMVRDVITV